MVNCACCWGQHIFSSMANEQAKFQMFFAQRLKKFQGLFFENSNNIVPDCFCNYSILQKLKKLYLHLLDLGKTFSVFSLYFGPYREYICMHSLAKVNIKHLTSINTFESSTQYKGSVE